MEAKSSNAAVTALLGQIVKVLIIHFIIIYILLLDYNFDASEYVKHFNVTAGKGGGLF